MRGARVAEPRGGGGPAGSRPRTGGYKGSEILGPFYPLYSAEKARHGPPIAWAEVGKKNTDKHGRTPTRYEVYVHTGVSANSPRSGTRRSTRTGTLSTAGYHTLALSTAVPLTAGQRFSVVVKFTTPGQNYPLPVELAEAGYSSRASASPGRLGAL